MTRIDWIFLCEHLDFGPDDEIVSLVRIVRPIVGFRARALPLVLRPFFALAIRGTPNETVTFNVTIGDGSGKALGHEHTYRLGANGAAEVAVPLGTLTLVEPGVYEFTLRVNGETVFTIKAPLARSQ